MGDANGRATVSGSASASRLAREIDHSPAGDVRAAIVRPRFQADYDLNCDIVSGVLRREPSIDFRTGHAAGFEGIDDRDVLTRPADGVRILITHDQKTMPKHFANFVLQRVSPGVLIVPQSLEVRRAIEDVLLIWAASDAEQRQNVLDYLPLWVS